MRKSLIVALLFCVAWPAYGQVNLGTSTSSTNPQRSGDATTGLLSPGSGAVAVSSSGTEQMRVNGSGVGIGTTSPNAALQIGPNFTSGFGTVEGLLVSPNLTGAAYDRGVEINPVITSASSSNVNALYVVPSVASGVTQGTLNGLYVEAPQGSGTVTNYYPGIFVGGNVGIGSTSPVNLLDLGNGGGIQRHSHH